MHAGRGGDLQSFWRGLGGANGEVLTHQPDISENVTADVK